MKLKSAFIFLLPVLCILLLTTFVQAQGNVPAPYTGLKNPFEWSDASAQTAGRILFRQYCLTCHGGGGVEGRGVTDLKEANRPKAIESEPDYYFWKVSDGIADTDMPLFKFSLSETQRWQVLTYVWSLGAPPVVEPVTPVTPVPPPVVEPVTPVTPVPPPVVEPVTPVIPVPPPVVEPVTPVTPIPAPTLATSTPAPTPTPTSTSNGGGFSCSKPAQANQGKNDVDISLILGGMGWLALVFVSRRRP